MEYLQRKATEKVAFVLHKMRFYHGKKEKSDIMGTKIAQAHRAERSGTHGFI